MKLSDFLSDNWAVIVRELSYGGRPKKEYLAAALRRHESVPSEAQDYIAALLDNSKGQGRPLRSKDDPYAQSNRRQRENLKHAFLVAQIDELIKSGEATGPNPLDSAFKILVKGGTQDAIRRRYRKAVTAGYKHKDGK